MRHRASAGTGRLRRSARVAGAALFLAAALAGIVRLTLRDRWPVLSVIFYAMPPLVIAATAFLGAIAGLAARRRRLALVALAGAVCATGWGVSTSSAHRPASTGADSVRVMLWNVNRGAGGWEGLSETIRAADADVVGLVEASFSERGPADAAAARFPDFQMVDPVFGIMLLVRGECTQVVDDWFPPEGKYRRFSLEARGCAFEVWVVDLENNPFGRRAATLDRLARKLARFTDRPVVVMGDFNTPPDAVVFDAVRAHAVNAFEAAGRGYSASWPVPLPVLTLDQLWVNAQVRPVAARLEWSWRSDHRAVIADLEIGCTP